MVEMVKVYMSSRNTFYKYKNKKEKERGGEMGGSEQ